MPNSDSEDDMSEVSQLSQLSSVPSNMMVGNYPRTPPRNVRRRTQEQPSTPRSERAEVMNEVSPATAARLLRITNPYYDTHGRDTLGSYLDSVDDETTATGSSGSQSDLFSVGRVREDGSVRGPSSSPERRSRPEPLGLQRMFPATDSRFRRAERESLAAIPEVSTEGAAPVVDPNIFESPVRGRAPRPFNPHPFPEVAAANARILAESRANPPMTPIQAPIVPSNPDIPKKRSFSDFEDDEGLDGGAFFRKGKSKRKSKRKTLKKKKRKTMKKKKSLKKKRRLSKKKIFKKRKH